MTDIVSHNIFDEQCAKQYAEGRRYEVEPVEMCDVRAMGNKILHQLY